MANSFLHNNERILRCSNCETYLLHEELSAIAEKEGLSSNAEIAAFLDSLNQDIYGYGVVGCDILEQFQLVENKKLIQVLMRKTVDKILSDKTCTPELMDRLAKFKNTFCSINIEDH